MWSDFRKFLVRGNVLDMAVGIIIGAAFTTVVKSLVDDVIMPPIGRITGGMDFSNLFVTLGKGSFATLADAKKAGAATINYGLFLNSIITFMIVAFCVFMLVRAISRLQRKEAAAPPPPSERVCPLCAMTIPVAATRCGHCTADLTALRA
jgi:large conductance mechanosensitive channel